MKTLPLKIMLAVSSAVLVGCSISPEPLSWEDGPDAVSNADVGDQLILEHVALSYVDDSEVIEVCYLVDEGMEPDDFLTRCASVDVCVPIPEGYDFELEGFQRKEPDSPHAPNGWDRVADVRIEITGVDDQVPEAKIVSLEPSTRWSQTSD